MSNAEIVILTESRLAPDAWQPAIDEQRFPVSWTLDIARSDPMSGAWVAQIEGARVPFVFNELNTITVIDGRPTKSSPAMPHMFSTPASGDLTSCAVGSMALLAYGMAVGGVLLDRATGTTSSLAGLRQSVDAMAAAAFGKPSGFGDRYPADAAGSGRMTIEVTRAR